MEIYDYRNFERLIDRKMDEDNLLMQDDVEIELKKLNKQLKYF